MAAHAFRLRPTDGRTVSGFTGSLRASAGIPIEGRRTILNFPPGNSGKLAAVTERGRGEAGTRAEGGAVYRIVALSLMAVLVGFAVSLAAIAFVESVAWLNQILLISPRMRVQHEGNPMLLVVATLLVPTLGGVLVGAMFTWLSREHRSLGPADVVRAAQLNTRLPDFRSGMVSTLAAVLSLGAGASVGQYGPIVYLGAMVGRAATYLRIRINALPTIAIACGVAAAISTAFNAPIAGLVFAHEVILRHYSMQAFAPTTVASATGYVVANVMFDRPALFLVSFSGVGDSHEFVLFALLGIVSAGIAAIFMKMILGCAALAERTGVHATLRTGFAGLAVGVTALWLPDVLGIGTEALRFATIEGAFSSTELLVLVAAKIILTALCIGFGFRRRRVQPGAPHRNSFRSPVLDRGRCRAGGSALGDRGLRDLRHDGRRQPGDRSSAHRDTDRLRIDPELRSDDCRDGCGRLFEPRFLPNHGKIAV